MFNKQTAITPSTVHACASDTANLLLADGLQASPWCGQWNTLGMGNVTDLGDCQWGHKRSGLCYRGTPHHL